MKLVACRSAIPEAVRGKSALNIRDMTDKRPGDVPEATHREFSRGQNPRRAGAKDDLLPRVILEAL